MAVKSRREEYAEATRAGLVAAARPLFAARGYAETSVDEIARAARVTKGALYHHFANKRELFEAVVEMLHREILERVARKAKSGTTRWGQVRLGIEAFLDCCLEPECRRVVLQEAPAVMGWERWRELDERYSLGALREDLRRLMETREIDSQPVELLARILFGTLTEAAMTIAHADDETRARAEAGALVMRFLECLRPRQNALPSS